VCEGFSELARWQIGGAQPATFALSADAPQLDVLIPLPIAGRADFVLELARGGALRAGNLFDSFDGAGSGADVTIARGHAGRYTNPPSGREGANSYSR